MSFLSGNRTELLIDGHATFRSIFEGIDAAQKYLLVQFYIVRDDTLGRELKKRLERKAKQGVRVYFLYDAIDSYRLPRSYTSEPAAAGVQVHRYQEGFLHGKTFLVDDMYAGVGTVNLDNRSFRLNFEVTALVVDQEFALEVEQMFLNDFARFRTMTLTKIIEKPFWFRVASRAAYLTAPLL